MFDPFLLKLGPLGVAVLFVVVVAVVVAPGVWDVAARLAFARPASATVGEGLGARLRATTRAAADAWRTRSSAASSAVEIGSLLWAAVVRVR